MNISEGARGVGKTITFVILIGFVFEGFNIGSSSAVLTGAVTYGVALCNHAIKAWLSMAGFWAFTLTVGWIVRGFMGIPMGHDQKPKG